MKHDYEWDDDDEEKDEDGYQSNPFWNNEFVVTSTALFISVLIFYLGITIAAFCDGKMTLSQLLMSQLQWLSDVISRLR